MRFADGMGPLAQVEEANGIPSAHNQSTLISAKVGFVLRSPKRTNRLKRVFSRFIVRHSFISQAHENDSGARRNARGRYSTRCAAD
ncbi:hypothetical protein CDAR_292561 [Caerostris darwini]|uniref:Uncharacterized protein n=1 Tax=Caerostris darwini TaxID=1538125 RepID=A0AAV4MR53_9ARAC|nr:hypothetical protein CDAR_292561 [Caerostris darwini]